MPRIKQYVSQIESPGPINNRTPDPDTSFGRSIQQLGSAMMGFGDVVQKRAEQEDAVNWGVKSSELVSNHTKRFLEASQQGKVDPEAFLEELNTDLDGLGEEMQTGSGKQTYDLQRQKIHDQFLGQIHSANAEFAAVQSGTSAKKIVGNFSAALTNNPSAFENSKEQLNLSISALAKSHGLPEAAAIRLKAEGEKELAKAAIQGWTKLNPEATKAQLNSGKWDEYLDGDLKHQLFGQADQEIRARRVEDEDRKRREKEALQESQKVTQNDFLQQMLEGKLSTKSIMNSNLEAFGSGSKEQFIQMLEAKNKKQIKTDSATFLDIFDRIHLPDGDPKKIVDENDLNYYMTKGLLDMGDLNALRKEIQGKNTTQGKIEADLKKRVIDMAKNALSKSNPLTGFSDPVGDQQLQRYMVFFWDQYTEKRKKGKSAIELLSPDSPEYLGKHISRFARDPMQIMKDLSKHKGNKGAAIGADAGAKPVVPRNPGESAKDYMKRVKGN